MEKGDIQTKKIIASSSGSFLPVLDRDMLAYLGYTQAEIESGEIALVFKAEVSEHRKIRYIGIGKPLVRK